jgi:hypothetical protein
VLVVDPTPGVPTFEQGKSFVRLQHLLLESHVDYLLVDVDILQTGRMENARLRIQDLEIELIIVPPMVKMEAELAAWLEQFESGGGRIARFDSDAEPACRPGRFSSPGSTTWPNPQRLSSPPPGTNARRRGA